MAKSALELAVETGKWNSGLKKAKSALDNFTQSQGGLQQALGKDSEKIQQFVRMMGQADSTAKTAKGQMNDYKSTIEQLTMQYNRLTDAQKKTLGQDYLRAIDQMKQKYQGVADEVDKINKSLKQTSGQSIGTHGGGIFSGMGSKMEGALAVFGGNLMTKAAGAVAQFGSEMADMVKQGVEMAKAGEGIRIAFERLGRGDILDGLREATHGTVTDIELMKAAVKFNDFKLPLDELGTMLAFAQQKAKDTGQSVDYMVDSIVTGLGRKSLMILDNLGLSATEVKDKMKETGDMTKAVGAIIREQMAKAGDYVETAADRAAQANVSLQNKMEELGRKFAPVEEASSQLWTSMKIAILDIVGGPLARLLNGLTEAGRLKNAINDINGDGGETRSSRRLRILREYSGSQAGVTKQTVYDRQIARYAAEEEKEWRKVNELTRQRQNILKELGNIDPRKDEKGVQANFLNAQANSLLSQINDAKNHAKAIQLSRQEYEKGAKQLLNPSTSPSSGTTTPTTTTPKGKAEVQAVSGSIDEQTKKVQELQKAWRAAADDNSRQKIKAEIEEQQYLLDRMTGKEKFNPANMRELTDLRGTTAWATSMEDMKRGKDRKWYDATAPVAPSELTFSDGLQNYMKYVEKLQVDAYKNSAKKKDGMEDSKKVTSGLYEVASGLQQMGIMLPQEVQQVLGVINGLMTVIEGVNTIIGVTQAAELTANTAAMVALTTALNTNTAVSLFKPFARGGIVPHAANGYFVPGTHYSNDVTPIMANAGELVLNRAQQGNLAAQLGGGGLQDLNISAIITGEQIRLVLNNNGRRTGRGEYVTTNFRRYGD